MNPTPAQYWRAPPAWSLWLGRTGTVLVSTIIHVGPTELAESTPYAYVLVDFVDVRRTFMGIPGQKFSPGDTVECVWRKIGYGAQNEIQNYGIKVRLYHEEKTSNEHTDEEMTPVENSTHR